MVYENEHGIDAFALTSRYSIAQDPLTGSPYSGVVEVEWSGPFCLALTKFESWLKRSENTAVRPDVFLGQTFDMLHTALNPSNLRTTLYVESTRHGSYRLVKENNDAPMD